MFIEKAARERGINEVIHFTTNEGLVGILHSEKILPNARLQKEDTLEFIFKQNSEKRKERDLNWLNYINFSLTKVNSTFFSYSQYRRQSDEIFWVIIAFSTEVLDHLGVYFTTTNNIYPSNIRKEGMSGFENMFSDVIEGRFQQTIARDQSHLPSWTTCEQAEVLYPNECSIEHLSKIYVKNEEHKHSVKAILAGLDKCFDVEVALDKFQ
ncbi:DUF4433 domain-containing protein [Pseudoalteromonas sp. SWXJZ94C]|uniref:DarT ssDNA thymidine ADP-ribosyltransferase family protein n=1 Tax=Pseudoalteromonas sp. SWXJZ94C TaxID=2792065 RepID=UPI0018CECF52|nr:DarT ssDNA thymidine ADP-ribosyltransferase family protein [Pseudoalteromonas sp. SWXJZ94C]MBH0058497.1 DUF4433 domain-containing protein [Pseudoalteromonas sp. SWXJZ94C]